MASFREIEVEVGQEQVVSSFLRSIIGLSARKTQEVFRKKKIRVNGRIAHSKRMLMAGDRVSVPNFEDQSYGVDIEQGPLRILYEDDYTLVVDKPPFMLVHPTERTKKHTLSNYLAGYYARKGQVHRIRPLHRLDRDTSGCILFAKTAEAQTYYMKELAEGRIRRTYRAWVEGCLALPLEGLLIEAPIGKDPLRSNRRKVLEGGQLARTYCFYVRDVPKFLATEVELTIPTGRTHQIRVHMAHIGHSLVGDGMYGTRKKPFTRQCLHAFQLEFKPFKQEAYQRVSSPLGPNFGREKK